MSDMPRRTQVFPDDMPSEGVLTRRLGAWLVDAILLTIAAVLLWVIILIFGLLTFGLGWPLFGLLPLLPISYQWLFLMAPGSATVGMRLFGLTVRRDIDLGPPSPLEALAFTLLFTLTIALGAIWLAAVLVTTRQRTFHEILSGLTVMNARGLDRPMPRMPHA